ncbi:MAG TPA: type II 3-dehydroquinate dehydratase [Solirubrobacteraceae bacterium]|nr:type II 3-dehydroquinate dehydratase [Solirubrobacteraceae bacterium]
MPDTAHRVEVLHGVNLDMLGRRDPALYGTLTLPDLQQRIEGYAAELGGLRLGFFQSNFEGELVQRLHRLRGQADGIVINAGAWSHYAWALRDALEIAACPAVEVHLSDVKAREPWRRVSIFDGLCLASVSGHGAEGYRVALARLRDALDGAGAGAADAPAPPAEERGER